ncbi:MAG: hypothetical protein IKO19_02680 [Candidatus Riflebacteria bacterium]|nr:hypothetical protein [Candidatus Riflebacteria bacterium]
MLDITIPSVEGFDEKTNKFVEYIPETRIQLEHSLISLSKWEARWKKPFLSKNENKTQEELLDYIKCMCLTSGVDSKVFEYMPSSVFNKIVAYIEDPMTATTFSKQDKSGSEKIVTNEIIYYWMITLNIPFECQKWHLNRLLTLIRVCSEKNAPSKKMSQRETVSRYKALNMQRRAQLNSRG